MYLSNCYNLNIKTRLFSVLSPIHGVENYKCVYIDRIIVLYMNHVTWFLNHVLPNILDSMQTRRWSNLCFKHEVKKAFQKKFVVKILFYRHKMFHTDRHMYSRYYKYGCDEFHEIWKNENETCLDLGGKNET